MALTDLEDRELDSEESEFDSEIESDGVSLVSGSDTDLRTRHAKNLCEALDAIQSSGSFATSGSLDTAVDPQIHVDGVGRIKLPLSEQDARSLVQACYQAPFGKGSETIIDTSVRNTWELNPNQFQIQNPAWAGVLDGLVGRVSEELGLVDSANVEAQLYKMLLYEKGAMFKAHKDTEKAPGMFGTLVICLPSAHTGGSVKVKHAGQEKTFRSEELRQSYVSWFADVTHEVAEIESGYRWVLTYNLVNKSPSSDKANLIPGIDRHLLRSALREWWDACLVDPTEERAYCYILEHQYTDANLGFDSLKGQDAAKIRALRESCQDGNFCCLLANLHREVWGACVAEDPWPGRVHHNTDMSGALSGGDFHVIDQDEEVTTKLNHVLDQDGTWVGEEIPISEDAEIIQFKPFRRDPDDEDFMGYTGNEGAQATHTYRDSVVVVMPRQHLAKFLLGRYLEESRYWKWSPKEYLSSPQDIRYVVNYLRRVVETNPTDEASRLNLEKAARLILDRERTQGNESLDYCVSQAVRCSFTLRNSELFEDAASLVRQKLEDEAMDDVVVWIRQSGLAPLEKALGQCFSSEQRVHARYNNLQNLLWRVRNVNEAVDEVKELNIDAWVEKFMEDSVEIARS